MLRAVVTAMTMLIAAGSADAQPSVPPGTILYGKDAVIDPSWRWFQAEPAITERNGWVTLVGGGEVTMAGGRFHALLHLDPEEAGAEIALDGRIAGDRVVAQEILLNTDAGPVMVHGTIKRTPRGDGWMIETIVFRGGQSGDASFLGLVRRVRVAR
ncbi:hypothetical protein [Sphingomonas nostoxanthinifaciens]|uniref:hypothetical protein n=1 Tax=Sphingomonas nostoxanthinifaciens TaxID=2872652 RepID=UPI001CC1FA2C|nr:hypothetical protein [Sphingomonas nostoxanthinifaciens]UAK26093.1 hypothetical protein K8P63_08315 [Sphingomonas nostoxanthinifaciens]